MPAKAISLVNFVNNNFVEVKFRLKCWALSGSILFDKPTCIPKRHIFSKQLSPKKIQKLFKVQKYCYLNRF